MRITLYNVSKACAAGVPVTFDDIVVPFGGDLCVAIANNDGAHDDLTVSTALKSPTGVDFFPDLGFASGFGSIAHGTAKGFEQGECAFQILRITLLSATGVSSARVTAMMVRGS
jgi:hypothetical protein